MSWLARARTKGFHLAPDPEEFTAQINEYIEAKNAWRAEVRKGKQNQNGEGQEGETVGGERPREENEAREARKDVQMIEPKGSPPPWASDGATSCETHARARNARSQARRESGGGQREPPGGIRGARW